MTALGSTSAQQFSGIAGWHDGDTDQPLGSPGLAQTQQRIAAQMPLAYLPKGKLGPWSLSSNGQSASDAKRNVPVPGTTKTDQLPSQDGISSDDHSNFQLMYPRLQGGI